MASTNPPGGGFGTLIEEPGVFPDLSAEHTYLVTYAQIACAVALCDDDLHVQSLPLWESALEVIDGPGDGAEFDDTLRVLAGTGYGRFCVETGRLTEAEPWLRRAGARAQARGWHLATARTQLERATAAWAAGNRPLAQDLVHAAYPAIAEHAGPRRVTLLALLRPAEHLGRRARRCRRTSRSRRTALACELGRPLHIAEQKSVAAQAGWTYSAETSPRPPNASQPLVNCSTAGPGTAGCNMPGSTTTSVRILRAEAMADPDTADEKFEQAADVEVPAFRLHLFLQTNDGTHQHDTRRCLGRGD